MKESAEINALLHLMDDPDQEVFETVANKIVHLGKDIIPNLELIWEKTLDEGLQERIELLIHRLHFKDLQEDFQSWSESEFHDLLRGALLVSKYQFPDLQEKQILADIEKIKRNIWLELNNYLTPLEKINVLNSMIYSFFGIKGSEISYQNQNQFFLNQVMESKKGNPITIGILYQVLCERLELPVMAVNLPRQFILAYFDQDSEIENVTSKKMVRIHFFIDPIQGQIYTIKDIETYLKRIKFPLTISLFRPIPNKKIIKSLIDELSKCFNSKKEIFRRNELQILADILNEP